MSLGDEIDYKMAAEYFRRSYTAVDGLWFLKMEERYGFPEALEMDREVWKVVPKIQARTIRTLLREGTGFKALAHCLKARMNLEGFEFQSETNDSVFRLFIQTCPWHDIVIKAGREELGSSIGEVICGTEMEVWAGEFSTLDETILFRPGCKLCQGDPCCLLEFSKSPQSRGTS